ncbi:ribosome silencing factor [Ignavigranum ruoffiae]|uniref:ribosome silencing factor n=1 Tax=Ignavigranum ruoffiae TaxID=89093 RepID=UPI003D15CCFF
MTIEIQEKLEIVVKAADDRLAQDILVLDVHQLTPIADYFVIMDASNERQLGAIVDAIVEKCQKNQIEIKNIEGKSGGRWVLIDIHEIVVHVFYYSERAHYNLEKIWLDAPTVDISQWLQ